MHVVNGGRLVEPLDWLTPIAREGISFTKDHASWFSQVVHPFEVLPQRHPLAVQSTNKLKRMFEPRTALLSHTFVTV